MPQLQKTGRLNFKPRPSPEVEFCLRENSRFRAGTWVITIERECCCYLDSQETAVPTLLKVHPYDHCLKKLASCQTEAVLLPPKYPLALLPTLVESSWQQRDFLPADLNVSAAMMQQWT